MLDLIATLANSVSAYLNINNAIARMREDEKTLPRFKFAYRMFLGVVSGFIAVVYFLKFIRVIPTPLPYELMDVMLFMLSIIPLFIGVLEFPRKDR